MLNEVHLIPEGQTCTTILKLYNENAIVVEPAGALSIAALDDYWKSGFAFYLLKHFPAMQ